MQERLLVVLIAALANAQLVDTWHNGTIFKRPRAFFERWEDSRWLLIHLIGELALCSRCLMHWTAVPLLVLMCELWGFRAHPYSWPLWWLAVIGLSRVFYKLAGGDEEEEERDPLLDVPEYQRPFHLGGSPDSGNPGERE